MSGVHLLPRRFGPVSRPRRGLPKTQFDCIKLEIALKFPLVFCQVMSTVEGDTTHRVSGGGAYLIPKGLNIRTEIHGSILWP